MSDRQSEKKLTHFNDAGDACMVDVGHKQATARGAEARVTVKMSKECFALVKKGEMSKGDVLGVARIAGIMAAKKTPELIPLAHPININSIEIAFELNAESNSIQITSNVACFDKTGVEMEALTAASAAALTVYDMCKAVDRSMIIDSLHLLKKKGGKSGTYSVPA